MAPLSAQGALPLSSLAAKPGMNSELFAIFFFFLKQKFSLDFLQLVETDTKEGF